MSVRIAEKLKTEIVICDSMQIYAGMSIGTAQPTEEERNRVKHCLVGSVDPCVPFSAADYALLATNEAERIIGDGHIPVFCGGTGLYLESFLRGGFQDECSADPEFRQRMTELSLTKGPEAVYALLLQKDPEAAASIHPNNVKRVIRALEIIETSGEKKTDRDIRSREKDSDYDACVIGLGFHHRELLYQRINDRVEKMISEGLLEEVSKLRNKGVFEANQTAAQAIGYKELFGYLDGKETLDEAKEKLMTATRHYAKRQLTWFSAKPYVHWVYRDMPDGTMKEADDVLFEAISVIKTHFKNIFWAD